MIPVVVASKGRPEARFLLALQAEAIPYTLFVEPQDLEAYGSAGTLGGDPVVLAESDRGLPYARAAILEWLRTEGPSGWVWMPDDDLTYLVQVVNGKTIKNSIRHVLETAETYFVDDPEIGQASIDHQQFAFRAKQPYVLDSYCDGLVAIRGDVLGEYRGDAGTKADRDYTLQVLAGGMRTLRVTRFGFATPSMRTLRGGCYDWYQRGDEERDAEALARLWPGLVEVVDKRGHRDAKIKWRYFRDRREARARGAVELS